MEIQTVPESARWSRPDLIVEERTLPNGAVLRVWRDLLGRVRREERPDGTWVRFLYRLDGSLEGALASWGERVDFLESAAPERGLAARTARTCTELRLGEGGLPKRLRQTVDGHTWETSFERDPQGRVVRMRTPEASEASAPLPAAYARPSGSRDDCRLRFTTGVEIVERGCRARALDRPASIELQDAGGAEWQIPLRFDERHRVASLGELAASYDEAGRLTAFGATRLHYDEAGRLRGKHSPAERVDFEYDGMAVTEARSAAVTHYDYDVMGRRSRKRGPEEETCYGYNLLGLLAWVVLPSGQRIEYLYDGFGRLVGRSAGGRTVYFIVGLDGERLAEADETGQVTTSYLWLGRQCVGRVEGPIGGMLLQTFHRGPGARLLAVGDSKGRLGHSSSGDPFGTNPVVDGVPGFAGLFGDSLTGLLHAGSRWLDPQLGQFITPDTWLGVDPGRDLPSAWRPIFRRLPGGAGALIKPEQAYAYCGYDPINQVDPSGHSAGGLTWSIFSALLWESQLTGLAYEMEFLNVIADLFLCLIFAPAWATDWYWKWSIYNLAPPAGSSRIGAFAWVLNGLLKIHSDRDWTLGNVIWASGSEWSELAEAGSQDLVICENTQDFLGRKSPVAVDLFRVRNSEAKLRGTVSAAGDTLTGVTWDPAAPAENLDRCLEEGDWLAISMGYEATEEYRKVFRAAVPAADSIQLDSPATPVVENWALGADYHGKSVRFEATEVAVKGTGVVSGSGQEITNVTLTSGTFDLLYPRTTLTVTADGVKDPAAARVHSVAGTTINVLSASHVLATPALPAPFFNQAVTIYRLDSTAVRLQAGGVTFGRTVKYISGNAVHLSKRIPAGFASEGITVEELSPARNRKGGGVKVPACCPILRFKDKKARDGVVVGGFLRVSREEERYATAAKATRLETDLTIDPPLPTLPAGKTYEKLTVTALTASGASAAGQSAFDTGTRVGLGDMAKNAPLGKGQGLAITAAGATERRIVMDLRLQIPVVALDGALQGKEVLVQRMRTLPDTRAEATVGAGGAIAPTDPKAALPFEEDQVIELRRTDDESKRAYATVDKPADGGKSVTLKAALPGPDFVAGTAVVAYQIEAFGSTWKAEPVGASRDTVVFPSPDGLDLGKDEILQIRSPDAGGPSEMRRAGEPVTLAVLDSALPASHAAGLAVEHFVPGDSWTGVAAPAMGAKIALTAPGPWAVNDIILLTSNNDEAVVEVGAVNAGATEFVLKEAVELTDTSFLATTMKLLGQRSAAAKLDSATVMAPSDMEVEQTQRKALEHHELRHAFQGALWGPFLVSMPVPWLLHLGFSFTDSSSKASGLVKYISTGGVDSLLALPFWGMAGGSKSNATASGSLGADRRTVTFTGIPDDELAKLETGGRVTVSQDNRQEFNVIDSRAGTTLQLRFQLPDAFAPGAQVTIEFSRFDQVQKWVSVFLGQNYQQIWADYIPSNWGRALSRFLDHDSWLPGLGIYFLALYVTGFDEIRLPTEQEAAYYSGDLYTTIVVADPCEVYVGQIARLYAFVQMRGAGGLATQDAASTLQVQLPPCAPADLDSIASKVSGSLLVPGTNQVRFRTHRFLPMNEKAGNVVGVLFNSSQPGTYLLRAPGQLPIGKEVVFVGAFDVGFLKASRITVKPLEIKPSPADPIYETAWVNFDIKGGSPKYTMSFPPAPYAAIGQLNSPLYQAPLVPDGKDTVEETVQVFADYGDKDPLFKGPGQAAPGTLPASERHLFCEEHKLVIQKLTPPNVPPVKAGSSCTFLMPLKPGQVALDPATVKPAGATTIAAVVDKGMNDAGKTEIVFWAPDKVLADTTFEVTLTYATAAGAQRLVKVSIKVLH